MNEGRERVGNSHELSSPSLLVSRSELSLFKSAAMPVIGSLLLTAAIHQLSCSSISKKVWSTSDSCPANSDGNDEQLHFLSGRTVGLILLSYLVILLSARSITLGLFFAGEILWGCNFALLLAGIGMWTNCAFTVGTAICIVAVDQVCWYFDVVGLMLTGDFPVGVARYMASPKTTWVHFVTGTHHLWFMPVSIAWLRVHHRGIPTICYWGSVAVTPLITIMARVMTPYGVKSDIRNGAKKESSVMILNINMCYAFVDDVAIPALHFFDHRPPYLYLPYLFLVFNFVINVVPVALLITMSRY